MEVQSERQDDWAENKELTVRWVSWELYFHWPVKRKHEKSHGSLFNAILSMPSLILSLFSLFPSSPL